MFAVAAVMAVSIARAEFEKVELDFDGEALSGSVLLLNPLTAEFSNFKDGVFVRMLWIDQGNGLEQVYSNLTGISGLAADLGEDVGNFDIVGNNQGDVFFVNRLNTDLGNRGEGILLRLGANGFEEFVPPATERLGQGADGKFYYAFPEVADNGTLVMLGYDNRFPHFVLRVVESSIEIIAQESVTPVPNGGGMFSRFGADFQISADGSIIAFRGERTDGQSGLYHWTDAGITTVADSSMNIPGRAETFNGFFDSSITSFMGNDGATYIVNASPRALVAYRDGALETLLVDGDLVEGQPVQQLSNVQQAPNGEIFVQAVRGFLRYRDGAWENFQLLDNFETTDGKRLTGAYLVAEAGVYFHGSVFIREELRSEASLYLRAYDSDELIRILNFDSETFGDASGGVPRLIEGDRVLFANQTGQYVGSVADLSRDIGGGGALPQPEPELSGFEAALASLPEALRGATADADGDGISNLIEYVLGLPLDVASSSSEVFRSNLQLGSALGLEGDSQQYLTLQVKMRSGLDGIDVRVVTSDSVVQLATEQQAAIEVGTVVVEGDFERRLYRSTGSIEAAASAYIGLVAELNP